MKRIKRIDTKYRPWMCDAVIEVAEKGGFHAAMMLRLGISRGTFYSYIREYPEFARAVEQADLITQSDNENTLSAIAKNKKAGDFKAVSYILQTKFAKDYPKDVIDSSSTNITINNLNLTSEERDHKIAQLAEKLRAAGHDLSGLLNPTTKIIEEIPSDDHPDD